MINLGPWEIGAIFFGLFVLMVIGYIFINGIIYTYKQIKNKKE